MPGFFGLTHNNKNADQIALTPELLNIHVNPSVHVRKDYSNEHLTNIVVSFDFMRDYNFFYQIGSLDIWIYGDPLLDSLTGKSAIDKTAKLISESFPGFSKLAEIDGLFDILILDRKTRRLYLLGDRNGMAHLFYGVFNNQLIWGSELRLFVNRNIKTTIKSGSLSTFLELGYLVGDSTWFNEVRLLPPASCLEWDIERSALIQVTTYWSHKQLIKNSITRNSKQIVNDLTDLISAAVSNRAPGGERIGITLSGGQDSRAIFANIPFREKGFFAITRGINGCGDIQLARRVTKLRKDCTHIIKEITAENWADGRCNAAIATSGQKDILNMNAISSLSIHKNYFDINLDGAGGDAILKGGHLVFHQQKNLEEALRNRCLRAGTANYKSTLEQLLTNYKQIDSDQYFFVYGYNRRFSVFGAILGHDYGIISRYPLLDHKLLEYLYQLSGSPDTSSRYNKMLVSNFPEYFVKTDTLITGRRLYVNNRVNYYLSLLVRLQKKFGYEKYRIQYHDYPNWFKHHDHGILEKYVFPENLPLYQHVDRELITKAIELFRETGKKITLLARIISLNIFLEDYAYD